MKKSICRKIYFFYLPVLIWMGVIFFASSVPGLKTGVDSLSWEIALRKGAHILEYVFLAFLFFRLFYFGENFSLKKTINLSAVLIFCYAVSDEMHQFFITGRSGRVLDVFLDFLSGFLAIRLLRYYVKSKR